MLVKNGEIFTVEKKKARTIPMANLIDEKRNLNPLAKKIFVEWFNKFSENGKMSEDQCAAFIHSCTSLLFFKKLIIFFLSIFNY